MKACAYVGDNMSGITKIKSSPKRHNRVVSRQEMSPKQKRVAGTVVKV